MHDADREFLPRLRVAGLLVSARVGSRNFPLAKRFNESVRLPDLLLLWGTVSTWMHLHTRPARTA